MGDELMAAGHAARVSREAGGCKVAILDRHGRARVHELWEGLDFISPVLKPGVATVTNGAGCRPYIDYPFTSEGHGYTGWRARDHRPVVSPSLVQRLPSEGFVLVESTIKPGANPNKRWRHWQAVVDALPSVRFVQCRPPHEAAGVLRGVEVVQTSAFVDAMRVLGRAAMYLGPEGGMHHAAAALGVPAVVIFGGSPSIEATGYEDHVNFGASKPCGRWSPCGHCAEIMNAITVDRVVEAVKEQMQ